MKERGGALGVGSFTQAHLEPCSGIPLVLPGRRRDGMSLNLHDNDNEEDIIKACPSTAELGWIFSDDDQPSIPLDDMI